MNSRPDRATRPAWQGVESSVSGAKWVAADSAVAQADTQRQAERLHQMTDLPPAACLHLAGRGVQAEDVDLFLSPTLRDLMPDPSSLQDLDKAAGYLAEAVASKAVIGLFGDYDVDGACSAALMARVLNQLGCATRIHIPDRFSEGYGPNLAALEKLQAEGCSLILTLDCGITAHAPLAAAADLGMTVLVVDHHKPGPDLPRAAALVNPNRLDDASGLGHLAAAGVCFMVLAGLLRQLRQAGAEAVPDLREHLDLVALATVCDVVPLLGLNRAFVRQGLKILARRQKPGLAALADIAKAQKAPDSYMLGFLLGPRINAAGRLGRSDLGVRLLCSENRDEAAGLAEKLDEMNRERRETEQDIQHLAEQQAELKLAENPDLPVLIVAGEGWHEGVIGIVAGRLKDKYNRPCVVIAAAGGQGKGSARGMDGLRLGDAIMAARQHGLLLSGGGHDMAAGLSLEMDRLAEFEVFLTKRAMAELGGLARKIYQVTSPLSIAGCTAQLADALDQMGPYGAGHAEPRLVLTHCRVRNPRWVGADAAHLSCRLDDGTAAALPAIGFRLAGSDLGRLLESGEAAGPLMILGKLGHNDWQGPGAVQFQILDAARTDG